MAPRAVQDCWFRQYDIPDIVKKMPNAVGMRKGRTMNVIKPVLQLQLIHCNVWIAAIMSSDAVNLEDSIFHAGLDFFKGSQ